jgi:ArsR family transcriptional regulator
MKKEMLRVQASAFNALAHPLRLKILDKLRDGPCCVCKIIPYVGGEQPNVSHHLGILRKADIVRSEKHGTEVWYAVNDPAIFEIIDMMINCIIKNLDRDRDLLKALTAARK